MMNQRVITATLALLLALCTAAGKEDARIVYAPTAVSGLVYNDTKQPLVNGGTVEGGTMVYSLTYDGQYTATIPVALDAGTYSVWYKVIGDADHNDLAPTSVTAEIDKATVRVKPHDLTVTYRDPAPLYYIDIEGLIGRDKADALRGDPVFSCDYVQYADAGEYTITVSGLSARNYNVVHQTGILTVKKAAQTILAGLTPKPDLKYNGQRQELIVLGYSSSGNDVYYSLTGKDDEYARMIPMATEVGDYTVYYRVAATKNYLELRGTVQASIGRGDGSIAFPSASVVKTYGDAAFAHVVTLVGDGAVNYTSSEPTVATVAHDGTVSIQNAGTTVITATTAGTSRYDYAVSSAAYTLTVKKADAGFTMAPIGKSDLVYNGTEQQLLSEGLAKDGTVMYCLNGGDYSTAIPTAIHAGRYNVSYKVVGDRNHNDSEAYSVNVDIGKAKLNVTPPTPRALTYTAQPQPLVDGGSTDFGTMQYKLMETDDYAFSIPTATRAGRYIVYYIVKTAGDWDEVKGSVQVDIRKADPVVAAPKVKTGLVYNGAAQELVEPAQVAESRVKYRIGHSGEWTTDLPMATAAGDYTVSYYVEVSNNYNAVPEQTIGTVSIGKAPLTVTANDMSIDYNKPSPAYTVRYDGFLGSDNESVLGGTLKTECPYALNSLLNSDAGTYPITPSGLTAANYNIRYVGGTLTVNKIAPTVIISPKTRDIHYDGFSHSLMTFDLILGGKAVYSSNGLFGWGDMAPTGTNAGDYTFWYKISGDRNHTSTEAEKVTVTIFKKTVIIRAKDATIAYGDPAPKYELENITGFALLDNFSTVIGGDLEFHCNYKQGADARDDWEIWPQGYYAKNSNYVLRTEPGTLTVEQADISELKVDDIPAVDYDGTAHTPQVTVRHKGRIVTPGINMFVIEYANNVNAGQAQVIFRPRSSGSNFKGDRYIKEFTINKIPSSIVYLPTSNEPLTYNGQPQPLLHGRGEGRNGTMHFSLNYEGPYSTDIPTAVNPGRYTVWYKVVGNQNYSDTEPASITVNIDGLTLQASDITEETASDIDDNDGIYTVAPYITHIADGTFADVKDVLNCIDLTQTSISYINVSRTDGPFRDVSENTLIYVNKGSMVDDDEPNVIIKNGDDYTCSHYQINDGESDIIVPYPFTADRATFSRTFDAGVASTIFLPFVPANTGGHFYKMTAIDLPSMTVDFTAVAAPEPNTPYIYRAGEGGQNGFSATNVRIDADDEHVVTNIDNWQFIGVYSPKVWTERGSGAYGFTGTGYTHPIEAGVFVRFDRNVTLSPCRAYLQYLGDVSQARGLGNTTAAQLPDRLTVRLLDGDDPTAIRSHTVSTQATDGWYTLDGRRLKSEPTMPGLYIRGGKKLTKKR